MKLSKRLLCLCTAIFFLVGMVGCGQGDDATSEVTTEVVVEGQGMFTPGEYEAEANGNNGPVGVKVTFDDTRIVSIEVVSHNETAGISDAAFANVPNAILDGQTLAVDTVTGATNTSTAIIEAVSSCVLLAGGDIVALSQKKDVIAQDITKDTDVVVVGAGLAGLSAAVSASNAGANVILLEKAGTTGGATATSGGEMLAAGTSVQEAAGIEDSAQALIDYWLLKGEGKVDEEVITYVGNESRNTIDWFISMGTKLEMTTPTSMPWQDPMRCHKTAEGIASTTGTGGGVGFTNALTRVATENGVEIMLETPATELIMDGADVVGVIAKTKQGGKVTINAKSVILATGGFDGNDEMMKKYSPLILGRSNVGELHNGDGLRMALDAGGVMVENPSGITLAMDIGATGLSMKDIYGKYLYVLPNGERFMDESQYWFVRSANLIKNNVSSYWTIVSANSDVENLDLSVENKTAQKGETIEELATNIGVDPAVLKATVDRYNSMCASGVDTDFGKTDANMKKLGIEGTNLNPIENGPFYALYCATYSVSGTFGGPKTNMEGEVLNADGEPIKGLYAVGEVANSLYFNIDYPCSGSSLQFCATLGRLTGEVAAAASK